MATCSSRLSEPQAFTAVVQNLIINAT